MNESICVTLEKFVTEKTNNIECYPKGYKELSVELKLSFDGNEHFIEEAWLDETIDFYDIADKYNFLDKLLEEALTQLKKDRELASLQDKVTALEFESYLSN